MKSQKNCKLANLALFCVICMICTIIPFAASAESNIAVEVTDVANDIITISGSAPIDTLVSIKILNPGVKISDTVSDFANTNEFQFMDVIRSKNGKFSREVKMNTGVEPNKNEGAFTILVSINGKLEYKNTEFMFYSNETKQGYVNDLKTATKAQLLEKEENEPTKLEKIFVTYSLSSHELYKIADIEDLAEIICNQQSRTNLSVPSDVKGFLINALVLNAFDIEYAGLFENGKIKYAEIWAENGDGIDQMYSKNFLECINEEGKSAVVNKMFTADYSGAQFDKVYKVFEEYMYYHLLKNYAAMGTGHIQPLLTEEYKEAYKNAGFDASLLTAIKNSAEKTSKLNKFLDCSASDLSGLASQFNSIMKEEYKNQSQGAAGGGGGPSSSSGAPAGGGGGGFTGGTETPKPTQAPTPTETPDAAYPFKDMKGAAWASEAVEYLYKNGIVNGRSEVEFVPDASVTRAELVKMVCEALKVEETEKQAVFSDVSDDDWFAPFVNRAFVAGIVNGDGGAFFGNREITREDAALIIFRALGLKVGGELTFADKDAISDYAKDAVATMANKGLINGMGDGTFAPKATLTRAQAAQLIYNAIKGGTN